MSDETRMRDVTVGGDLPRPVTFSNDRPLVVIAGPCQLEGRDHAVAIARAMAEACADAGLGYVFKASYDKANRTSLSGKRGVGMAAGLEMLAEVRAAVGCPVLTDVHGPEQCAPAAQAVDILQIPAFLCRQTDLLLAAGETGAAINVKKGQFLAPWDIGPVADKVARTGNDRILLTERGVSFGYNALVADMRALPIMARTGWPVVMDATHAVQQPGGLGGASGGQREFAPVLARAATALGIAAVFVETHPDPDAAPSDGPNMVPLAQMPALVASLAAFDRLAKSDPLRP
jgi:2-dehydro-3-deoxyphosphooctonate aldolase (KDO 8-P synthase)